MDEAAESMEFCGLDGPDNEPPTRHETNKLIRTARVLHLQPVKKDLREQRIAVQQIQKDFAVHMKEDEALKNQLKGAKYVLWGIAGVLAFAIPLMLKILEAVQLLAK